MNTVEVIKEIKNQLKVPMGKWVDAQCERIEVLREYKKSDTYESIESDMTVSINSRYVSTKSEKQFHHLQDLGYTKRDNQILGYHRKEVKGIFQKDVAHKLLRVDVAVNKKLKKLDIKEIYPISFRYGLDGFIEGDWIIITKDDKQFKFIFETILAGGYNIQCLHIRTKYQLKEIK